MKRLHVLFFVMAMVMCFSAKVQALTVVGDGTINGGTTDYQLIYDSAQNITWLDYTHFDTTNLNNDTWQGQVNWAQNLTVTFDGKNITGWSLPTTVDAGSSYNYPPSPSSSEMAYLYYTELGNTISGLTNVGPFENLQAVFYWSGTGYSSVPNGAWGFGTGNGLQGAALRDVPSDGLAVLPGDVAASTVPEPGTVLLVGTGLAALAMISRRRRG